MMKSVDTDGSGAIGFDEFQVIHAKAVDGSLEFAALKDAMQSFDKLMADLEGDSDDSDDGDSDAEEDPPEYESPR